MQVDRSGSLHTPVDTRTIETEQNEQTVRVDTSFVHSIPAVQPAEIPPLNTYTVSSLFRAVKKTAWKGANAVLSAGKAIGKTDFGKKVVSVVDKPVTWALKQLLLKKGGLVDYYKNSKERAENLAENCGSDVYGKLAHSLAVFTRNWIDTYIVHGAESQEVLDENLRAVFIEEKKPTAVGELISAVADKGIDLVEKTIEKNYIILFNNLFESIGKIQKENPDYLVDVLREALKITATQLKLLEKNELQAKDWQVKNQEGKRLLCNALSQAFFRLACPNGASDLDLPFRDLPVGTLSKEALFDTMQNTLLPNLLFNVLSDVESPLSRSKMLFRITKKLKEVLEVGFEVKAQTKKEEAKKPYAHQKEIDEALEEQLIQIITFLLPKQAWIITPIIKKNSAKIGEQLVDLLRTVDLQKELTKLLTSNYEEMNKDLTEKKFPKTKKEIEETRQAKEQEKERVDKELSDTAEKLPKNYKGIVKAIAKAIVKPKEGLFTMDPKDFGEKFELMIEQAFTLFMLACTEAFIGLTCKIIGAKVIIKNVTHKIRVITSSIQIPRSAVAMFVPGPDKQGKDA
jgi:hypothetical protein